ncbi:hypothetical protein WJ437_09050 [Ignavigranum ruoffiae]|uniref:hypothetical protein n=1 Tax=Ignavigranum ruoffiae TaxID=89093 RepID=UPI003B003DF9
MEAIRPRHYKNKSGKDLFDQWHNEYNLEIFKAIMISIAERYIKRNKDNPIQDIETLSRLKEYMENDLRNNTGSESQR